MVCFPPHRRERAGDDAPAETGRFVTPIRERTTMSVALDFDGTLSDSEMTVLLGGRNGTAEDMAGITDRAMNNEIEYAQSLRERCLLLEGLPDEEAQAAFDRVRLHEGAADVIRELREADVYVAILTGGFERGVARALKRERVEVDLPADARAGSGCRAVATRSLVVGFAVEFLQAVGRRLVRVLVPALAPPGADPGDDLPAQVRDERDDPVDPEEKQDRPKREIREEPVRTHRDPRGVGRPARRAAAARTASRARVMRVADDGRGRKKPVGGGRYSSSAPRVRPLMSVVPGSGIERFVTPVHEPRCMIVAFDFDGTLSDSEMTVLLGERNGTAADMADITERAMNDEVAYAESLRRRCALLEGLPDEEAAAAFDRVALRPGAADVIAALRETGVSVAVLTGGFERGVARALDREGIEVDAIVANRLPVEDGALTGEVEGPLIDGTKDNALEVLATAVGEDLADTVAVGDGANDLPMLQVAGLAVGFDPKPAVAPACDSVVDSMTDLAALLADESVL